MPSFKRAIAEYKYLHQTLVLNDIWEDLFMNFALSFSQMQWRVDSVFVMVDKFSKMTQFISYHKTPYASHIARLFFCEVVHLHEVSNMITSDHDVMFLNHFWVVLGKMFDMSLNQCTTTHIRIDEKTKVTN